MSAEPTFSVVIATYDREEFIRPTLESVQNQDFQNFEVLVVSDGPASKVLQNTVSRFDERFSLYSLKNRSRSQSGPNNEGWRLARGRYIAYLGHDDIWHPKHLSELMRKFEEENQPEFVVSGCIYFGPPGMEDELTWVSGIFSGAKKAPLRAFFPPSSFGHRRELGGTVAFWPDAMKTRRPVDNEFLIMAAKAGCQFVSTETVTVFKFASALRYLSYRCPEDYEQREMLTRINSDIDLDHFIAKKIEIAKSNGSYMRMRLARKYQFALGEKVQKNEIVRGIKLPKIRKISEAESIVLDDGYKGFDWHRLETDRKRNIFRRILKESSDQVVSWRWSGPSHKPRILLPFFCEGKASIVLKIIDFAAEDIRESLRIFMNGSEVEFLLTRSAIGYRIEFTTLLPSTKVSVLEFSMNRAVRPSEIKGKSRDSRKIGLCLSGIEITPEQFIGN